MADHADPIVFLDDLIETFEDGSKDSRGIEFDPELCSTFVEGLREAVASVRALATLAEEAGLIQRLTLTVSGPRTPLERRLLAAMAVPLDADGRVVAFPRQFGPALVPSAGGSAA
ncbi:hypothetical protein ACSD7O_22365 [Methylorubrum extorquens]|uniref:hypothetical protein n=1 Tax=Methylorubrum extorquens TaxID=408 RepID=UPI003F60A9BE